MRKRYGSARRGILTSVRLDFDMKEGGISAEHDRIEEGIFFGEQERGMIATDSDT